MDPEHGQPATDTDAQSPPGVISREHRRHKHRLKQRTPHAYRVCERFTEILVYAMVIFSPWAFGSTQPWAVWVMNIAGYALGLMLAVKWIVRRIGHYTPPKWGDGAKPRWTTRALAVLTVLLLGWCLISALNARATIDFQTMEFNYRDSYISWLPHSYHAPASWFEFWKYLGLACTFWAVRDWLLGQTRRERAHQNHEERDNEDAFADLPPEPGAYVPTRLRRLLWLICLNGVLLAAEGIFQRLDGTSKLLWLIEPTVNKTSDSQFGPYAYRSNAAQYLNLVWPVCLGLFWILRHEARRSIPRARRVGSSPHLILLPCAALIAAAPFLSMSRGGVLITAATAPIAITILYLAARRHRAHWSWMVPVGAGAVLAALAAAAWPIIKPRLYAPRTAWPISPLLTLQQFTLRCAFHVPPDTRKIGWGLIVGLSRSEDGWYHSPADVGFVIRPRGAFNLIFFGPRGVYQELTLITNVIEQFQGQTIDVALVREELPRLYLNGAPVPLPDTSRIPSMATNEVSASYLRIEPKSSVFDTPPALVSVWERALDDAEIAALHAEFKSGQMKVADNSRFTRPLIEIDHSEIRSPALLVDQMSGRRETYAIAAKMLQDFVWLGSGPGTFGPLYGLYRSSTFDYWTWWAHNDWLEFRITLGRIGVAMALLALGITALSPLQSGGLSLPRAFPAMLWVGMLGCLAHARFDFPFQIHSIALLFLILACLCSIVSRR
ncbi:MAG: O-antigen ligase family protein [Verrucomicrobia bacterium]|nr:O-antigen ligase family protein [Verrucomicrobiota bacterium]